MDKGLKTILIHNQNNVYKNPPLLYMYMLTFPSNFEGTVQFPSKHSLSAFYTLPFLRIIDF